MKKFNYRTTVNINGSLMQLGFRCQLPEEMCHKKIRVQAIFAQRQVDRRFPMEVRVEERDRSAASGRRADRAALRLSPAAAPQGRHHICSLVRNKGMDPERPAISGAAGTLRRPGTDRKKKCDHIRRLHHRPAIPDCPGVVFPKERISKKPSKRPTRPSTA